MIKRINKIQNLGVFARYSWDSKKLEDFSKYNLFYGWNSSGKTTLSRVFADIEQQGHLEGTPGLKYEITLHPGGKKKRGSSLGNIKVKVFNEDFVKKNISFVEGTTEPILILGEESKKLIDAIEKDTELLDELQRLKATEESKKNQDHKERDTKFQEVAKTINTLRVAGSNRYTKKEAEQELRDLPVPKTLDENDYRVQIAIINQETKSKIVISLEGNDFDLHVVKKNAEVLCSEKVSIERLSSLSAVGEILQWVERGIKLHLPKSSKCYFCDSGLTKKRLDALQKHFNKEDKELKEKIECYISDLQEIQQKAQALHHLLDKHENSFHVSLSSSFAKTTKRCRKEIKKFCIEITMIIDALNNKKQLTTEVVNIPIDIKNKLPETLDMINKIISQHNNKIDNRESEIIKVAKRVRVHHLSQIHADIIKLDKAIGQATETINKLDKGSPSDDPKQVGILELENRRNQNRARASSKHKACQELNEKIPTFLRTKEITFQETDDQDGYILKRGNQTVAKDLSSGERTALALMYFIVHLQEEGFDPKNGIIVVDDPISSLDDNSIFLVYSSLKEAVQGAKQVFIFTHNFDFLRLLIEWLKNIDQGSNSQYYMVKNRSDASVRVAYIDHLDKVLQDYSSEYHYLFQILYNFNASDDADFGIDEVYCLPNIARKVLEAFLDFQVPSGENRYARLMSLGFHGREKVERIHTFTNKMSHPTGSHISPSLIQEARDSIRDLLEMIKEINPRHYEAVEKVVNSVGNPKSIHTPKNISARKS